MDPSESLSPATALGSVSLQVTVPAPWQQHPALRNAIGVGWYWRTITVDAAALSERAAVLHFGAVDYIADVFLNGAKVGMHEGGYLPFELDVSQTLKPGANTLVVRVDDAARHFPEVPHGKQSWYGPISGMWQSVTLDLRPRAHITALKLSPHGEQIDVTVALNAPYSGDVRVDVIAPDGRTQIATSVKSASNVSTLALSCAVPNPQLWDIDYAESLHRARVVGRRGRHLEDTCGFRTIEARDGKLWLNGRPVYLRSALDQDYYPDDIYTRHRSNTSRPSFARPRPWG